MAQPISRIQRVEPTPEQQKEQALDAWLSTLTDNADGLRQTAKLLQELHASGILPALQAFLQAKEQVASIALDQIKRPPVTNMINNAMEAAGALSAIEPDTTRRLMSSLSLGLNKAEEGLKNNDSTSLWELMKITKDPDINRAITFGINLLKGVGQGLKEQE